MIRRNLLTPAQEKLATELFLDNLGAHFQTGFNHGVLNIAFQKSAGGRVTSKYIHPDGEVLNYTENLGRLFTVKDK